MFKACFFRLEIFKHFDYSQLIKSEKEREGVGQRDGGGGRGRGGDC